MPTPAPTVLLDLDGTLIDSEPGIVASVRAALVALGHAPAPSLDLSALIGPPAEEVMRRLLQPYGDDRVAEAVAAYRADYGEHGLFASRPYPGVGQALAAMREAGAELILATSKRGDFARRILQHFGLEGAFTAVHGAGSGGALDHKPELIAHIVERHGLERERCVMVGDRSFDVAGAHANRISALGVLWGYGTREELQAAGADGLVGAPDALPDAALAMAGAA
jgi:phosphoglycolate phosphatase